MLSEQDLLDYMRWSSYFPQTVEAMRPQIPRAIDWLAEMGVTESPLRHRERWATVESARAHDLLNLWLLQSRPTRDKAAEHEMRNLLARLGAGVRPYKP